MNKLPSSPAREIEMPNNLFRPETPEITMYTSQKLPNLHYWNAGYLLIAADLYGHAPSLCVKSVCFCQAIKAVMPPTSLSVFCVSARSRADTSRSASDKAVPSLPPVP